MKSNNYDIIIAVDKGLESVKKLKIKPDYVIGDFDSVDKKILKWFDNKKIKIIKLNPEKDFTDTHSAIEHAINIGATEIVIIGATGTRIDHVMGNINILKLALDKNINAKIVDENNEIQLINKTTEIIKNDCFKYISFIPLTTNVTGVTLSGFKYEIEKQTLSIGNSLGVSNEQTKQTAKIDLENGILIMIKSKD